jgi:P27 family predicted phage terminase small subunit
MVVGCGCRYPNATCRLIACRGDGQKDIAALDPEPPGPSVRNLSLPDGFPRQCWDEITRVMVARNIYDSDCNHVIEAYCIQRARFLEADVKVRQMNAVMDLKKGRKAYNPWISISNVAFDRMVRLASELGITPVTRQRAAKVRSANTTAAASKFLKTG